MDAREHGPLSGRRDGRDTRMSTCRRYLREPTDGRYLREPTDRPPGGRGAAACGGPGDEAGHGVVLLSASFISSSVSFITHGLGGKAGRGREGGGGRERAAGVAAQGPHTRPAQTRSSPDAGPARAGLALVERYYYHYYYSSYYYYYY